MTALVGVLLTAALPGGALPTELPTELPTGLPGGPTETESPSEDPTGSESPSETESPTADPSETTSPTASPSPTATSTTGTVNPPAGSTLTYAGQGATRAFALTIAGQGLNTGVTDSFVANGETADCDGVACALAAGLAEPAGENATATSPGDPGPNQVQSFDLGSEAPEQIEQILTLSVGTAEAATTAQPSAAATANGITADVTLTQTLVSQLPAPVTDGLSAGLGAIGGALEPVVENDPSGVVGGLLDVLGGLVGDLSSSPLLRIQGGESASDSEFEAGRVSARAQAAGAILTILPTPESTPLVPEGLAIIEVTPSTAEASGDGRNRATAEAQGSIARITLLPGVLDGLPGLDPGTIEETPLGDILDLLPPEVTDLLPIDDVLGGVLGGGGEEGSEEPTPSESPSEDGSGNPIEDLLPTSTFMQADEDSGGFVIDLETGSEQTCILEGTPVETCITVGGTSENYTADGLGVGVLAAGVDISALRGVDTSQFSQTETDGLIELSLGRSEAGVAAAFVQAATPTPSPTSQTGLPNTGSTATLVIPALGLMAVSGAALFGLRRRREVE